MRYGTWGQGRGHILAESHKSLGVCDRPWFFRLDKKHIRLEVGGQSYRTILTALQRTRRPNLKMRILLSRICSLGFAATVTAVLSFILSTLLCEKKASGSKEIVVRSRSCMRLDFSAELTTKTYWSVWSYTIFYIYGLWLWIFIKQRKKSKVTKIIYTFWIIFWNRIFLGEIGVCNLSSIGGPLHHHFRPKCNNFILVPPFMWKIRLKVSNKIYLDTLFSDKR